MIYSLDGRFYIDLDRIVSITDIYEGRESITIGDSDHLFQPYFLVYCELCPTPVNIYNWREDLIVWRDDLIVKWQERNLINEEDI